MIMLYLNRRQTNPEIVCIEDVKFFYRLEIFNVVFWNLGYFQQPQMVLD